MSRIKKNKQTPMEDHKKTKTCRDSKSKKQCGDNKNICSVNVLLRKLSRDFLINRENTKFDIGGQHLMCLPRSVCRGRIAISLKKWKYTCRIIKWVSHGCVSQHEFCARMPAWNQLCVSARCLIAETCLVVDSTCFCSSVALACWYFPSVGLQYIVFVDANLPRHSRDSRCVS